MMGRPELLTTRSFGEVGGSHVGEVLMRREPWLLPARFTLALGVVVFLGAALWCLGGAGIYGSPLAGMSGDELIRVWAFLILGPFSVLPAAVAMWAKPRLGAAWLIVTGALSGCLSALFLRTDAGRFRCCWCRYPWCYSDAGSGGHRGRGLD
jgi:hypothetical protein